MNIQQLLIAISLSVSIALSGCETQKQLTEANAEPVVATTQATPLVVTPAPKSEPSAPAAKPELEHCAKHKGKMDKACKHHCDNKALEEHDCAKHCADHHGEKDKVCAQHCSQDSSAEAHACGAEHCAHHESEAAHHCNKTDCAHHKGAAAHQCGTEHCKKHGGEMADCCGSTHKCEMPDQH